MGRELGLEGMNGMGSERDFFPMSQERMIQSAKLRER